MADKKSGEKARTVLPSPKALERTAVEILADLPKVPLLGGAGYVGYQLVGRLRTITDKDEIVWTDSPLHDLQFKENRVWCMQVPYLGLSISLKDADHIKQFPNVRRKIRQRAGLWLDTRNFSQRYRRC